MTASLSEDLGIIDAEGKVCQFFGWGSVKVGEPSMHLNSATFKVKKTNPYQFDLKIWECNPGISLREFVMVESERTSFSMVCSSSEKLQC